jgi:arylmalonate decarboxylase
MSRSRRDFLKAGGIATAYAAFGTRLVRAGAEPAVGLIFPPLNYPIPPDAKRLYPDGVEFLSGGVGLPGGMTLAGYDEAIPRVLPAAEKLAKQGAKVISVFGSSLTFYKGRTFNEELVQKVTNLTGCPATTQSNGLVDGLRVAGAKRVALATAYTDIVTERLKIFLQEYGFDVTSAKGLGLVQIPEGAATEKILFKLGADAYAASNRADALVLSCGALKTLDLIVPLENEIKVPVVSSTPHGLMNAVRLLGVSPRARGFGAVLAKA